MDLELDGRVAVVTGAGRGIGLATTRCLVEAGVRVVAGVRTSSEELDALAAGGSVEVVLGDLAEPEAPARLVAAAGPRLDILVNNVGAVTPRTGGFLEITDAQWEATLQLDLMTAVRAIRAALPPMLAAGRGVIATVGSVNAFLPDPVVLDYGAAKAALVNMLKALSKEVGPRGIRVVTVNPGPVATDLWLGRGGVAARLSQASGHSAEQIAQSAVAGTATGRFTTPDEVARLLVLLASDRAANVTGAGLTVDGGLVPTLG
jgi:NAD(P)-dependent dehydrogenase (short-subunit alcohol dehydrogenase family)